MHSRRATQREARHVLEKHLVPRLGSLLITDVSRSDLSRIHVRMKKTPVLANRVLKVTRAMFSYALREGLLPKNHENPAKEIPKFKERKRDRHLSLDEYERLGQALDSLVAETAISRVAGSAIRFLALTGLRVGETLALRWSDVRLPEGRIFLRETKTEPRAVVLNTAAQSVLADLFGYTKASGWVFPGRVPGRPLVNIAKPWSLVRDRAGLPGVRLHDLRHSFASVGVASHLGLPVLGALLGHRQPGTTARYAHLADDPLRKATNGIGNRISAAMSGAANADVLPLDSGAT